MPCSPSHAKNCILSMRVDSFQAAFMRLVMVASFTLDPLMDHSLLLPKFDNRTITKLGGVLS